jgi:phosphoglycerate dehydrogenase-like enzyme
VRILLASSIDPSALGELRSRHDVVSAIGVPETRLREQAIDREAIIFRSGIQISRDLLDAAPQLRWLIRAGSGLDNLDLEEVERRGINLHRVPGPGARAVAELTFGLMLALARSIVVADRLLREGRWAKSELVGHGLRDKTLGVVGLGTIGTLVARMGIAWGMRPIGAVEHHSEDRHARFASEGIELASLDRVLAAADFLTIHVPLTERTRCLIDGQAIALMKRGSFLVNVARGGVVDEAALHEALASGQLSGAALDVHATEGEGMVSRLAGLSNVVLTPHIGASTLDAQREIGEELVRLVESIAASLPPGSSRRPDWDLPQPHVES